MDMSLSKLRELVMDRGTCRVSVCGSAELHTTEELNGTDWQTSIKYRIQEYVNYPVEEIKLFMNLLRAFKIINKIKER